MISCYLDALYNLCRKILFASECAASLEYSRVPKWSPPNLEAACHFYSAPLAERGQVSFRLFLNPQFSRRAETEGARLATPFLA